MNFKHYEKTDYQSVCDFLIALNTADKNHINWNWARFEWMMQHPEFDESSDSYIGLWLNADKVVGAAIYDMYFGEAFCAALPGYEALYPELLSYAYDNLSDESGLAISICDDNASELAAAEKAGFIGIDQTETVMSLSLDRAFDPELPAGFSFYELDPALEPYEFQWLLWRGFDHGEDRAAFEREEKIIPQLRPHLEKSLSLAAADDRGEKAAYCCLWFDSRTDYAYVEPVCTAPSYRGKGLAKTLLFESLNRASALGAKQAYVISDMDFYKNLGFKSFKHFTFYRQL